MTWDGRERRACDRTTASVRKGWWGSLSWHPFEAFVGVLLVVAGTGSLLAPSPVVPESPLVLSVGIGVAYAVGGAAIVLGLWRMWPSVEGFGLLLFAGGVGTALLTLAAYMGAGMPIGRSITFLAAATASVIRLHQILRGRQLLQVEPDRR